MVHGTAGFFLERARCARRSSLISLASSLVVLGLLVLPAPKAVRRLATNTMRFGFEGPEQYIRRITLENRGRTSTLADVGQLAVATATRKGGATEASRARVGRLHPRARFAGPGPSDQEQAMRSISRIAGVPVFQSEVEGKVTLQALVDTVGNVVEVQLISSTGEEQFEKAAEEAVWLCRFRPFRAAGEASEVYAVFRFSFKIY
ncbi:MAG: TonB family protein [Candidatus Eisenbacteria bacterium]|uniref:TonB family protein n=1 Tax=Eiseniibacteriota bacterium TaxID=2212470 RepID=A0A538UBX7_UNCEI|nr:MAG: TonB family protein [Candidatus Eisenbacteria bacterium]